MERVAALYDIHGNLAALDAVLAEVREAGVTRIVVGGDVVPGPAPRETLTRLMEIDIPVQFIMGNGDRAVLAVMRGQEPTTVPEKFRGIIRDNAAQLLSSQAEVIASWPATLQRTIPGLGEVLFCHATPHNDVDVFTGDTPEAELAPMFAGVTADVVVCGHTHVQFDRTVGRVRVVNAGSVGMPFGEPGAYWLLLGPDIQFRRTSATVAQAGEPHKNS